MNNSLDKIKVIDGSRLSSECYFQSLMEQAYEKGLLSDGDIERLQMECLNLLAYKTERYNHGDSSSIQVEKAQSIMQSNLFTIGLWLKAQPSPEDAVAALKELSISDIYAKGCKRIDIMVLSTKTVHQKLMSQLIDTPNQFYLDTIDGGIKGFFKRYNPEFAAQEIHITADYQVLTPLPRLDGIEFISEYTNALYYENLFCSYFTAEDIHHLLSGYAKDYPRLLINIYELVLTAAIGCVIAGANAKNLQLGAAATQHLTMLLNQRQGDEIRLIVQEAFAELQEIFGLSGALSRYVQSSLPEIYAKIRMAVNQQTLDQVFIGFAYPENDPEIHISLGAKMADEAYREMLEEMNQCTNISDKIAVLKEHIHSLADMEDVLLDAQLTQAEMQAVLSELGMEEIAVLGKRHPYEPDMLDLREAEQQLRRCLHVLIESYPRKQRELIRKAMEAIVSES